MSRLSLVLSSLLVLVWSTGSEASVTAGTDVTVRVYDAAGVRSRALHAALETAAATLASASVEVRWRLCDHAPPASKACAGPLAPGELSVRVVRGHVSPAYRGTLPLGDALIERESGAGVLATVYYDRVVWLAASASERREVLLGRAIAHEIGHLLMATTSHAPAGVMRPVWLREEIRRGRQGDWVFTPRDVELIRAATSNGD